MFCGTLQHLLDVSVINYRTFSPERPRTTPQLLLPVTPRQAQ